MTAPTTAAKLPSLVSVAALDAVLGDPDVRVLDATVVLERPPEGGPYEVVSGRAGYDAGHVPGAHFADLVTELSDPDAPYPFMRPSAERFAQAAGALGIGDGVRVVAYAQASPQWATRLWWLLRSYGFDAVSVLDGGLEAWKAAGLPLETATPPAPPAKTFTPRPRPELLATRADVEAIADGSAPACLLNALQPEVFRGEGPSSYARPGRIPRSTSLPGASLLDPESGRFRPVAELEAQLRAAGALGEEPVVAYCGGGIAATLDLFALHLAGREQGARLYDGSLTEWTADPELPLEVG